MGRINPRLVWLLVPALIAFAYEAEAAMVYGRVIHDQGRFPPGGQCEFTGGGRSVTVETDSNGQYSVFLPPGKYDVKCGDNPHWTATVYSDQQPVRQNIHLTD